VGFGRQASQRARSRHRVLVDLGANQLEGRTLLSIAGASNDQFLQSYGQIPLSFEANRGQTAAEVAFLSQGNGYSLFLTPTETVLSLQKPAPAAGDGTATPDPAVLRSRFVGANPRPQLVGLDQLTGTSNYFVGNDPSQWQTNIANYGRVEYHNLYPGVDLVFYGNQRQLEYDYVVAPGTDPGVIKLAIDGAESMALDGRGDLVLHTSGGDVLEQAPVVYQDSGGVRQPVSGQFVLEGGGQVGFALGAYDHSQPLVIDPVLTYSTYLGGPGEDDGYGIALDAAGNAYVTGYTASTNFPTTPGAFQTAYGGDTYNAFVTKLNPTGTALVYSTYLRGALLDEGYGIAVDAAGNAYVTGETSSKNFPTTAGAFQTTYGSLGYSDAFVTKLNPTGTALVYSTYLGGTSNDRGSGIAVDAAGNAYVTGSTASANFPTTAGAFQTSYGGNVNAFVTKLNPTGTALVYSTYLGGTGGDGGDGIAVDAAGNAYVTGSTQSANFPTTAGAYQSVGATGVTFVTKLNPTGTALVYSTYLGGTGGDYGDGIAVDAAGNAYVTGYTASTNFPTTPGAFQMSYGGGSGGSYDAFVTKLNPTGTALVYSTYLGGAGDDRGSGIAVDAAGNAYVTGYTSSANFPITAGALQTSFGGNYDAFVTKLNPTGTALVYSTYLGGTGLDLDYGIAVDAAGNAYVTGYTFSTNFPTTAGAVQRTIGGGSYGDAFVAKFTFETQTTTALTTSASPSTYGDTVTFTAAVTAQGSPVASGTVDFKEGNTILASMVPLSGSGTASFSISSLSAITHTITASYSGASAFVASSGSVQQVVNKKAASVTPTAATKVYGSADPVLTGSTSGFLAADGVTASFSRTAGETVAGGPYTIGATLSPAGALGNYTISYNTANFTITARPITVSADAEGKTYGDSDPALTYRITAGNLVSGDGFSGSPTRTVGENVGSYAINQGTLALSSNYALTYISANLTITARPITVTASSATKVYGAALPPLTYTIAGFVNGDTASVVSGSPVLSTSATASSHVLGSPYLIAISAGTLWAANYSFNLVGGTLTVTPAPLTITANGATKVYGAALPAMSASYSGFVNGDSSASLVNSPTLTTTANASSHVGSYAITASGAASSDYAISYVFGSLSVTPAALTIAANNQSKVYGAALPTLTASYNGLVNGDTPASLTTLPSLSTTASISSHVGSYAITASGATSSDYAISYVTGTLSITPAALTITADNKTKVYGSGLPALTASYSGWVNGDTPASLTTPASISTTGSAASHVGSYAITASGAVSSDYVISYVTGTLSVTPAALTITADNKTKVYGAALPTLTASYDGWVNGDTSASLTTLPSVSTTASAASHVGSYAITVNGAASSDYTISYVEGTLSVTQASLTITANNQTKVYGVAVPSLTASYTGWVNGDTLASLTTLPSISTTATAGSHVGSYVITASGAASGDYAISYVFGNMSVTPAALTITANNQTKLYGAALPTLTAAYTGWVNGDTSASLTALPSIRTTASAASHVGSYAITASGAVSSDYAFSYVTGSLSITPAALTINADNKTKVYGSGLPALTASYAGLVNGDTPASLTTLPSLSTTASTSSHVGSYAITAGGAASSDYAISYVTGTLSITPAALTITASNQTKVYGAPLPTLTAYYNGWVNGDTPASLTTLPSIRTTATAASHVGSYAITASGAGSSDYVISYVFASLSITPAALTITASNQSKVYGAPLPTLTASYNGWVNGDSSASLATLPSIITSASAASHVGSYAITVSGAASSDYAISYVFGSLSVTPAALTITADNKTKVYGAAFPALTASYAGWVNGDTPASLATLPALSTTASAASHVGSYVITASGAVSSDYAISYVTGTLGITPVPLAITANNATKAYGAGLPGLTSSYSGFVNGDTAASLATIPTLSTPATASSHVLPGGYPITASGASDPDYTITYVSGTLTVTPIPLTITANDATKVYGAALPALTASYSGWVNGDSSAKLATPPTLGATASTASHVGAYTITASGAASSDYAISYVTGTLSITPAALTITANNQTKVYGAALPTLTASYTGWVNGDIAASLTTLPSISTTASAASHVGSYAITVSGAASSDYAISYVFGSLNVTPAALTITANDTIKVYGAAVPALTAAYRGFVNWDSAASLTTPPTLNTAATASSHVQTGGYAINASGANDPDYTISYLPGTLTITPTALMITANNATKMYGAALPALTATYTGLVSGESAASLAARPVLATTASASSPVQPGGYAIIASGASDPDYAISYQPGTLLVTPAPLRITANNATMAQGAAVPPLSASYRGFVNGDSPASLAVKPTVTTAATSRSPAGTYPIVVGGASSPNYAINYANGILVVTPAPVKVLKISIQAIRLGNSTKTTQVIVVQFSGAMNPADAQSISNYTLTTIPTSKSQKSQSVALSQAQYNAKTNTVTLITRKPLVLNPPIRLTLNAARLHDRYGRPLTGKSVATLSKSGVTF
jgi:hypothetical protein